MEEEPLKSTSENIENIERVGEEVPTTNDNGDITAEPEHVPEEKSSTSAAQYDPKNVTYEGDLAIYTDPESGTQYEWCSETSKWTSRNIQYEFEGDTHVYTDKDGVKFFWDKEKHAWFPKLDDDFLAQYQMNYGFNEAGESQPQHQVELKETKKEDEVDKKEENKSNKGEKRKPSEPTWFEIDEAENTKVYVTNLPPDTTDEEFVDLMQKCGLVMKDVNTGKFKIKLYRDQGTGDLKGDALCTYIRIESVQLALNLVDGCDFKGNILKVERAKFQMKGDYNPSLKPKTKKRKEKLKMKKIQEKLFDWRPEKPEGERAKHEKVVIIKNLFDPSIFDTEVGLILEFQQDLREEVSKYGEVRKVTIYDRHPEGVAQINMSAPEEADEVVKLLNGRWFMKRQLQAEIWDGKTKFKIAETDAEINQRIEKWDQFLETDNAAKQPTEDSVNVEKTPSK